MNACTGLLRVNLRRMEIRENMKRELLQRNLQSFCTYPRCLSGIGFFYAIKKYSIEKTCRTYLESNERRCDMETRIAVIAIIVEDREKSEELNRILHDYGEYIVGRMGVPYRSKGVSVISVILDAPQEKISALSGKLGMLEGISSKTVYSKMPEKDL